jgi:hypothetical protein
MMCSVLAGQHTFYGPLVLTVVSSGAHDCDNLHVQDPHQDAVVAQKLLEELVC